MVCSTKNTSIPAHFSSNDELPLTKQASSDPDFSALPLKVLTIIAELVSKDERAVLKFVSKRFAILPVVQESKLTEETAIAAARYGSKKLLVWVLPIIQTSLLFFEPRLCAEAARAGKLEILEYALVNRYWFDEWTCALAAKEGHLAVLKWAHANGCPWNEKTCALAALGGHLTVLQWAHANGCPWDADTCNNAAFRGHLEVLQWAHANGCILHDYTSAQAAKGGHLEVLKWLRAIGCPWNELTCTKAAKGGHLKVLEWALDNNAPHDIQQLKQKASSEVKKWLDERYGT